MLRFVPLSVGLVFLNMFLTNLWGLAVDIAACVTLVLLVLPCV